MRGNDYLCSVVVYILALMSSQVVTKFVSVYLIGVKGEVTGLLPVRVR